MCVCSGVEQRCVVMSKDQLSVKCDLASSVQMSSSDLSMLINPATTVDVNNDDDDDDDDTNEAAGMQFATETIVKNFSRCIFDSSMIDWLLICSR